MQARINQRREGATAKQMPSLLDRAIQADKRWLDEIAALKDNPFAGIYASAYASFSFVSHASVTAISRVVRGQSGHLSVGEPAAWTGATGPYGFSISLFALLLLVSGRTLGWPPESAVLHASAVRFQGGPQDDG